MILEFWQGGGDPLRGLAVVVRALALIAALAAPVPRCSSSSPASA